MVPTHYEVLGVRPDASPAEVKAAYHHRARRLHPDAHAGSDPRVRHEAEEAMRDLTVAWHVLRHPERRARYDRLLATEQRAAWTRRRADRRVPELGVGFRHWLGALATATGALNLEVLPGASLAGLAGLPPDRLVGLHAAGSTVDDSDLAHLPGHLRLRLLDLSGTGISDAGLVHLQGLRSLEVLHLYGTAVTDTGLAFVGRLRNLRELGLGGTAVTDAGLAELGGLVNLRVLQLWGTPVLGPGLAHLHHLPDLEAVSLPWRVRARDRRRLRAARRGVLIA